MPKNRFKKTRPNPYQFSLVPESIWNPKKPMPALVLSRVLAGVSYNGATYTTTTGRELHIGSGESWMSIETIREDLSSAIGRVLSRPQIKYAIKVATELGFLSSSIQAPETKGRYGKVFTPTINTESRMIDPVQEYRIHAYGNTTAFTYGGIANANPEIEWIQRQPGDVMKLLQYTAQNGSRDSLFRTVGMWRTRKDVREANQPVFLPWIVLDLDMKGHIPDVHEKALAILSDLEDAGFDLDRCFASFSGSKGFHIAISSDQFGSPVFRDSDNARQCMVRFVQTFTNHRFDPSTLSPLQMLRLTGSKHQKSGRYKRTWTATRFRSLRLDQILSASEKFEPWQYPDPTVGDIEADIHEKFETVAKEQAEHAWLQLKESQGKRASSNRDYDIPGPSLKAALKGVGQGDDWGTRSGRDWAAFTIACYCWAHPKQHLIVREILNAEQDDMEQDFDCVVETLEFWNDNNSPPLTTRELRQKAGSAQRYLERRIKT